MEHIIVLEKILFHYYLEHKNIVIQVEILFYQVQKRKVLQDYLIHIKQTTSNKLI